MLIIVLNVMLTSQDVMLERILKIIVLLVLEILKVNVSNVIRIIVSIVMMGLIHVKPVYLVIYLYKLIVFYAASTIVMPAAMWVNVKYVYQGLI